MQIEKKIDANTIIKVQGPTHKDCYEQLVSAQEVFGNSTCGLCKSGARLAKFGKFCKAVCQNPKCGATLMLVCMDDGRMFPSRQNKDKSAKPNDGWEIYKPARDNQSQEPNREPQSYSQDEEVPFSFWIGLLGAGLGMLTMLA